MTEIILTSYSKEELQTVFRDCIKTEFPSLLINQQKTKDAFITENQAVKLLSVSKVSLKKWRDTGRIKFYRFGTRIRYKKSEILSPEIRKYGRAAK